MTKLCIRGGRVIDPADGIDRTSDVLIEGGRISAVGPKLKTGDDVEVFDATGLLVVPGLVDMHVHLREPGTAGETVESGLWAALRGGFTSVLAMPNTLPPVDCAHVVSYVLRLGAKSRSSGSPKLYVAGCITEGRAGKAPAEMGTMAAAGARAFSDDGDWVADSFVMKTCMEYAAQFGLPVISHCEDPSLCRDGDMNGGGLCSELGLAPRPAAAEEIAVARDIRLAELTGCRLHLTHLSTARSVELVRQAKKRKLPVTCDVTPHHVALTEEAVRGYDTRAKVNPPLRTDNDRNALVEGLADGTIDAIASDHAPHPAGKKDVEFADAAAGISGVETSLGVCFTELVASERIPLGRLIEAMSTAPARILGIEAGTLSGGAPADVTVIDPGLSWKVDTNEFVSHGHNSPFDGAELTGRAVATVVGGRLQS